MTQPKFSPLKYELKTFEKLPVKIWADSREASVHVARSVALAIRQKQQEGESMVLGLATGSSPIRVYKELVRMHQKEGLSFSNVITFNLDEYYPMQPEAPQSYVRFMQEHLFNHVDIKPENVHIPDGTLPIEEVHEYCEQYEKKIDLAGGLDIQLLGIGRTGHIGFNEPGSWETSLTRLIRLDGITRRDAVKDFVKEENVPYRAITMGVASIMKARKVFLLAWGQHKAPIIKKAVEGPVTSTIPSTFLQKHKDITVILDKEAAEELTRIKTPWLAGMCDWNQELVSQAVIWLSQVTGKPILKLTDNDYNENNLSDLIVEHNSAYNLNIQVHNRLQHTITGWPGGKPKADDSNRPERASPARKRVLVFSPSPDDDVLSMGGTLLRLVDQGHDVHVAYQTSGHLSVQDQDVLRYAEFMQEFGAGQDILKTEGSDLFKKVRKFYLSNKKDRLTKAAVRQIKSLIRRGEARSSARFCGLTDDHIHFLDMPFYEKGNIRTGAINEEDIRVIVDLLEKHRPHQVYAAGDLTDPHGTHRVCLNAITEAFRQLQDTAWMKNCWLWLYRGAWQEWRIHEIEMAVPLSPEELYKKRKAIFIHQSQKDRPSFPGNEEQEFWQRAEGRNRATATAYRDLGLAAYEAMEAFRRWKLGRKGE